MIQIITDRQQGLFPEPAQIEMNCSCPDLAEAPRAAAAPAASPRARKALAPVKAKSQQRGGSPARHHR